MNIDKMKYFRFCFLFFQLIVCSQTIAQKRIFTIDSNYLDRHDIVYNTPAYEGFEGFPLGNGDLGGMIWNTNSGYEIQINKNDFCRQYLPKIPPHIPPVTYLRTRSYVLNKPQTQ